ncbi:unnamed protein product [Mycena citricolor]|uniref:Uncharacterized protein n=1 Tax=Mycena citricolor TaxID=2018698 RepID=A0AAD2JW53_9AGAR|nr:unnamed protein product [Mycena citricolor]
MATQIPKSIRYGTRAKKQSKKMAKSKSEQRSLKFWAQGVREDEILAPHIQRYRDALERGRRAEAAYLQRVCHEYHARVPWQTRDNEEPPLPLPAYDPRAPVVEEVLEEHEKPIRAARKQELNKRIRRWLVRHAKKIGAMTARGEGAEGPFTLLLAQLTDLTPPSKARSGPQQLMHDDYDTLVAETAQAEWPAAWEDWRKQRKVKRKGKRKMGQDLDIGVELDSDSLDPVADSDDTKLPNVPIWFKSKTADKIFRMMSTAEKKMYTD